MSAESAPKPPAPAPAAGGISIPLAQAAQAASPAGEVPADLKTNDLRVRRWGWMLLLVGVGGFLLWAGLAPLDQGVAANGTVLVSGNRKTVQPLAGGLVQAILVKDGDDVKAGQTLVRLDATRTQAELEIARSQQIAALAVQARLRAEQAGRPAIEFPPGLLEHRQDPQVSAAVALQTQLFASRRANLASELSAIGEQIGGQEAQIAGLENSRKSKIEQQALLREEIRNQRQLVEDGFLPRNKLSEQQRLLAQLDAGLAEDFGNIARLRSSVGELKVRRAARQQEFQKDVESQLTDVNKDVAALDSRVRALSFDVANTEIKAPTDGTVVGLQVFTVGGVVQPGAPLMDIVPKNEPLRVDAQIPPTLIDRVVVGQEVDLLFTAFNQRTTPKVPGTLVVVGADALVDSVTKQSYYRGQVEVTPEGMKLLGQHQVRPGMPVQVFVRTGERTLLNYLIKPLRDRMRPALTEY